MTRPDPVRDLDIEPKRARALLDAASDLYEEYLERLPDLPIDRHLTSSQVRDLVAIEIPEEGMSDEALIEYLRGVVFDSATYVGHPGFMAYIVGAGTVPGVVADLVAAGVNQNLGGWRLSPGGTEIELYLTKWFARLFGMPEEAGGLVTSGGSMANFIALKVARDRALGIDSRAAGIGGARLTAYTTDAVHFATTRAADMLGIGSNAVRRVPADPFKLDVAATEERIEVDIDAGYKPFAIVANAGTVATGAVDPLDRVADLCERYGLWFHVDGAYGGPAVMVEDLKPLFTGIERADSIAFDPHKWMYTPQSGGVVLVRDLQWLAESFATEASYILHEDKELTGRGIDFGMLGPQLSRSFWALKIFISLLAHGTRAYSARISHDAALARYLAERATEHEDFEVMAPVELSICCFRYVPADLPEGEGREEYLDALNERLMAEVQMDGRTYYSNAVLGGRFVLRCCIVNYRTEAEHIDLVLEATDEIGARLDAEMRPDHLRP